MRISIVVAAGENNVIGKSNALLWRLPEDLKYFKSLTLGKPVVMGRKTFDSIGKPLPGRTNIVVSRQVDKRIDGCTVVGSLAAALQAAEPCAEVCIIGGEQIYRLALPLAHTVYLTRVHAAPEGDAYFPSLPEQEWRIVRRIDHAADERHAHAFSFLTLQRTVNR